jgi:hypothetical protein
VTKQSVPIVLAVTTMDKQRVDGNRDLVLKYRGVAKALLRKGEFYDHRKEERCARPPQPDLHKAGHGLRGLAGGRGAGGVGEDHLV